MTTLITAIAAEKTLGRCDERCYNGGDQLCNCICQGSYHGLGHAQAQRKNRLPRLLIIAHIFNRWPNCTQIIFHQDTFDFVFNRTEDEPQQSTFPQFTANTRPHPDKRRNGDLPIHRRP